MTDEDLSYIGAADALEAFRARRLSPVELMRAVIARAEATEPAVNALSARYFDEALAAARTAEAAYGGDGAQLPRPLEGLPFAAKDAFPIAGRTTTSGSLLYRDRIDTVTAPGTQRILDAGAILHARTATPEFCAVAFTQSRLWGITRSPWNLDCAAGGSSGGAGAALAAGSTIIADGTDVGGSIRIPASMCGVVGYKPPYGRVPLLPELMLDAYVAHGPMGRSVDDCALMLDVMAGQHPMDMTSLADRVTLSGGARDVSGWHIAISPDLGCFDVDPEIAAAIAAAAGTFEALGARVEQIELPWSRDDILQATATHFQHYFGNWIANETATAPALVNDYVHFFIDTTRALALPSLEAGMALEARLAGIFAQQMQSYDLLICPTVPLTGLQAGESWVTAQPVIAGRAQPSEYHWCMTELFNILNRYPVISLPCGGADNGMPIGLSLVGGAYRDAAVFTAARAFEDARGRGYRTPASRPRIGALIN